MMPIELQIKNRLLNKKQTLSIAESCSGGLLGHRITNIPGSSRYFKGGVIVYSNFSKTKFLGIPSSLIRKTGAVSEDVSKKMAQSVRKLFTSDFGISITGIAGPTGGTQNKPVGLTYIALATPHTVYCKKFQFKGTRLAIKTKAIRSALTMLSRIA